MCGEHFIISARGLGKTGSSPHVRGALSQLQCPCRWLGIIPACAGSTRTLRGFRTGRWDHPRMCGEHYVHRPQLDWDVGSSPHVRGARCFATVFLDGFGIIPACAGSTRTLRGFRTGRWDHPRMCGEHYVHRPQLDWDVGSSPHVRGARCFATVFLDGFGIIPACAGSTWSMAIGTAWDGDHPRMCGEHRISVNTVSSSAGSSPHVRGALRETRQKLQYSGIIPACAGSTFDMIEILRQIGDHPRMCGEHVRRQSVRQLLTGIIPACAGSTQTHRLHDQPRRDHPRMCGEHDVRPDRRQS